MMEQATPKAYSLIAVILFLAVLGSGYFLISIYYPQYQQTKVEYTDVLAENADLKQSLSALQAFLNEYTRQQSNVTLANLALPSQNSDMANFVSSMSQLSQESGIVLSNLQIEQIQDNVASPNSIQPQNIGLSASGNYLAFKDFLLRLEDHLRLIDVNQITLSTDGSTGDISALQYNIKLRTYYQQ